jgi:hypothetical protein
MSKRGNDGESEHSTSKKVNPPRLDFKSANETNNVTIAKINAMISLFEDHVEALRGQKLITTIVIEQQANDNIALERKSIEFYPPTTCIYAIELNGRKMKFTISDLSALLPMISPDKEAIVLESLKNEVDNTMVFYGRLFECDRDLRSILEELKSKGIAWSDFSNFKTKSVGNAILAHKDLATIESQTLWQDWAIAAIAYLKYLSKSADMYK